MRINKSLGINALLNMMRQACGIVFPLITYPYVTRVLGSESLGIYSFSDSIISYFVTFATLGIPTYAIREGARIRDDRERIAQFSAELITINSIALFVSYLILGICIITIPRLQRNVVVTLLLSVNIFANVAGRDWINTIFEDFLYITVRQIVFHLLSTIAIFIFIKSENDYVLYTVMMMIGTTGGYLANIFYTQKYVPLRLSFDGCFKQHLKPILFLFCSTVAAIIYIKSDITVIGFLCNDSDVGIYTLSSKVYSIIKSVLNAIIMVSIPRLSNYLGNGEIKKYQDLLDKLFASLFTIVIPAIVGLFILSSDVIVIMGGRSYLSGTPSLQILCIALIFAVFGCFFSQSILIVNRKEKDFLVITIISAAVNIILNLIIIPLTGITGAAITTAIAEGIVVVMCAIRAKGDYTFKVMPRDLLSVGIGCISVVIVSLFWGNINVNSLVRVLITVVLAGACYFIVCYILKNSFVRGSIETIRNRRK